MATVQEAVRKLTIVSSDRGLSETERKLRGVQGAHEGLAVSSQKTERATLSLQKRLESIQRQYDVNYRSAQALARVERDLNAAQAQGLISLQRKNELLGLAAAKTDAATAATGRLTAAMRMFSGVFAGLGIGVGIGLLTQLPRLIGDVVDSASNLVDTADKLGITTRALQELQFAGQQSGVELSELSSGLSFFNKSIGEAARGGGELLKILDANGIALRDQAGNLRDPISLLYEYADLVKNAGSAQDQATLVTKAFGRANDELIVTLAQGAAGLRAWALEAERSGLVLEDGLLRRADDLGDRWDKFTSQLTTGWQRFVLSVVDGVGEIEAAYARLQKMTPPPGTVFGGGLSTAGGGSVPRIVPEGLLHGDPGFPGSGTSTERKVIIDFETRFDPPLSQTIIPEIDKATDDAQKAIDDVLDKLRFEEEQLGRTAREQAIYNQLKQAGVSIDSEAGKSIAEAAGHLYDQQEAQKAATKAQEEALKVTNAVIEAREKLRDDLAFERGTALLSEEDAAIATRLRSIYGNDIPAALSSWEAGQIRINNEIKRAQELGDAIKDSLGSAIEGVFTGGIKSAEDFIDKLTQGIAGAAAKFLSSRLMDKLFGGAIAPVDAAGTQVATALGAAATQVTSAAPVLSGAATSLNSAATSLKQAATSLTAAGSGVSGGGFVGAGLSGGIGIGGSAIAGSVAAGKFNVAAAAAAIKAIESLGSGGYSALGRVIANGDRAYGAYQVMGNNIASWTKAALGYSMTNQQFLSNAAAQDRVFAHQFGLAVEKFGNVSDAASVWFTGQPLSVGGNRADINGMTGNAYVDRFNRDYARMATGGAIAAPAANDNAPAPVDIASVGGSAVQSGADIGLGEGKGVATGLNKLGGILSSPLFQQGLAGFSMGYQAKSPVMGGLSGALTGFLAGGPVGGLIGGAAGILGGIFGKSQAEKQALEEAKKAWEAMADEVAVFSDELRGKVMGDLGSAIFAAEQRFKKYKQAAEDAGESTGQLSKDLEKFKKDQKAEFKDLFGLRAAAYRDGAGEDDAALKAAVSMKALRKELLGFVSDAKLVGKGKEAKLAAQEYALSQIGGGPDTSGMSDYQAELLRIRGASVTAVKLLKDLGMKHVDAVRAVNEQVALATAEAERVRQEAIAARKQTFADRLFAATTDLTTLEGQLAAFDRQAQRDREEEAKNGNEAMLELETTLAAERLRIQQDFGKAQVEAARRAAEEAESELNRTARSIVDYVNDLLSGPQSTSSPQDRFAAAQTAYSGQLALAQSGNIDAQAGITKFADNLLEAAEAMYASSAQFQVIRSQVIAQLSALPAVQQATDPVVIELRNTNAAIVAMQGAVVSAIGGLPASIATSLTANFNKVDTSVNGLIDYTEFIKGLKDNSTLLGGLLTPTKMTTLGLDKNQTLGKLLDAGKLATELKAAGFSDGTKLGDILALGDMLPLGLDKNSTLGLLGNLDPNSTLGDVIDASGDVLDKLKDIYTSIDTNGDKQISFLEAQLASIGLTTEKINEAFAQGDQVALANLLKPYFDKIAGSSGGISKEQMKQVLTDAKVDKLFKALDGDNNGILTIKEATADTETNTGADGTLKSSLDDLTAAINGPTGLKFYMSEVARYLVETNNTMFNLNRNIAGTNPDGGTSNILPKPGEFQQGLIGAIKDLKAVMQQVAGSTDVTAKKDWDQASAKALTRFLPMISYRMVEQSRMLAEAKGVDTKAKGGWDAQQYDASGYLQVTNPLDFLINPITGKPGQWFSHGGIVGAYAPGGIVGNGIWNMDSVRARFAGGGDILLAGGEGIIPSEAMKLIGPSRFELLRNGQFPGNDNSLQIDRMTNVIHADFGVQNRVLMAGFRAMVESNEALRAEVRQLRAAAEATTRAVKEKPTPKAPPRAA